MSDILILITLALLCAWLAWGMITPVWMSHTLRYRTVRKMGLIGLVVLIAFGRMQDFIVRRVRRWKG